MRAKDVASKDFVSIRPEAPVLDAAALLVNAGVSAVAVVDEQGNLVGIVSQADVIAFVATRDQQVRGATVGADPDRKVADIMTRDVVRADAEDALQAVIEVMTGRRLKTIPVALGPKLIGMIDRADIMRLIMSQVPVDVESRKHTDEVLRRSVMAAIKGHPWSLAQRLDVVARDGTVHLWGVVPNEQVLNRYCEAARDIPNAKSVVSHMHVMPRGMRMALI